MNTSQTERLARALAHTTIYPEQHDQDTILEVGECGTVACLAGRVVLQAGYTPGQRWMGTDHCFTADPGDRYILDLARELLGLTGDQASDLFAPNNTLADLWNLAHEFSDGDIAVPRPLHPTNKEDVEVV